MTRPSPKSGTGRPAMVCIGCGKTPQQLADTLPLEPGQSADDFVWNEEGTLNRHNGHFTCTSCYIEMGMPATDWPKPPWQAP